MRKSVILVPSFDASMSAKRVLVDPCHESCLLTIPYLRMVVTPLSIHTIAQLAQNFRTALVSGKHPRDESKQAHAEAELPAKPESCRESVVFRAPDRAFSPPGDDLRSGLFELTPTLGTRPGAFCSLPAKLAIMKLSLGLWQPSQWRHCLQCVWTTRLR